MTPLTYSSGCFLVALFSGPRSFVLLVVNFLHQALEAWWKPNDFGHFGVLKTGFYPLRVFGHAFVDRVPIEPLPESLLFSRCPIIERPVLFRAPPPLVHNERCLLGCDEVGPNGLMLLDPILCMNPSDSRSNASIHFVDVGQLLRQGRYQIPLAPVNTPV